MSAPEFEQVSVALEKIIRPIVEGQIRGFLKEHPSIVAAVDWYKPATTREAKSKVLLNSLAKRIIRDLTCGTNAARLETALLEASPDEPLNLPVATVSAANPTRLELLLSEWGPLRAWQMSFMRTFEARA
jgi:hypothetical protein